jgi:hypothetical protein
MRLEGWSTSERRALPCLLRAEAGSMRSVGLPTPSLRAGCCAHRRRLARRVPQSRYHRERAT